MSLANITGTCGVALILLAYFLSVTGKLKATSVVYLCLNGCGAILACWSSYLLGSVPFIILEGTWAVVSAWALVQQFFRNNQNT
ncbi:MAG: hypothetical protein K1X91_03365 [Bacteriodetes bacterium]|nr:hypothetical protein [Bacteroidota bacterium]